MRDRLEIIRKVIAGLYQFLLTFLLIETGFALFQHRQLNAIELGYLVFCFILSYILRDHVTNILLYSLIHLLLAGFAFAYALIFLPQDRIQIIMIVALVGACLLLLVDGASYIAHDFILKPVQEVPWPTFVVAVFMNAIALYSKIPFLIKLGFFIPLILFFLYMLRFYIEGLEKYMDSSSNVSGLPMGQIVSMNTMVVTGIMILTVVVVTLAEVLRLDLFLGGFLSGIVSMLKMLLLILIIIWKYISRFMTLKESSNPQKEMEALHRTWAKEDPANHIWDFLVRAIFILIVSVILYQILKKLLPYLLARRQTKTADIIERLPSKKSANVLPGDPDGEVVSDEVETSMVKKARRIYKKRVQKYKNFYIPPKSATSGDIRTGLLEVEAGLASKVNSEKTGSELLDIGSEIEVREKDENPKFNKMTLLYNAVRYGNYQPSADDLKRMKEE